MGWQVPIVSDNTHGKAVIKDIKISNIMGSIKKGYIAIVSGFQGISEDNRITTLGRGGSDTNSGSFSSSFFSRSL